MKLIPVVGMKSGLIFNSVASCALYSVHCTMCNYFTYCTTCRLSLGKDELRSLPTPNPNPPKREEDMWILPLDGGNFEVQSWCKICGNRRWRKLIIKITKNYTFEKIFLYGWEVEAFTFLGAHWNPCFELCARAVKEARTQLALTINSQSSFRTLRPSNWRENHPVQPFSVL